MIYDLPHNWNYLNSVTAHGLDLGASLGHYIVNAKDLTSYAFGAVDDQHLRFEVRNGDRWQNDIDTGNPANRAEIAGLKPYRNGTPIKVTYGFLLENLGNIVAPWEVIGQLHQVDYAGELAPTPPPVAIYMVGNKMGVQINWVEKGDNTQHTTMIYTDDTDLVRNSTYQMQIICNMVPSPILNGTTQGQLIVIRNNRILVTYTGPLGITDNGSAPTNPDLNHQSSFWKMGIYRGTSSETTAATYSNLAISQSTAYLTPSMTPTLAAGVVSCFQAYNNAGYLSRSMVYKSDDTSIDYRYNGLSNTLLVDRYDYKAYPTQFSNQVAHYNYLNGKHHQDVTYGTAANGSAFTNTVNYDVNGVVTSTSTVFTSGVQNGQTINSTYTNGILVDKFVRYPNGNTTEDKYDATTKLHKFQYNVYLDGSRVNYNYGTYTPYQKGVVCSASNNTFDLSDGKNDYATCAPGGGGIFDFNVLGFGAVAISQFHAGSGTNRDMLRFKTSVCPDYTTLRSHLTQVGSDAQFTFSDGGYIKLIGVAVSSIVTQNVLFH